MKEILHTTAWCGFEKRKKQDVVCKGRWDAGHLKRGLHGLHNTVNITFSNNRQKNRKGLKYNKI